MNPWRCARGPRTRLARVAAKLGIADTSTEWQQFVARDDLDVISIATPTVLHREMTLAALDAGKAVLCEKPLAGDLDAAADVVRAAEKSGRPTACCFENRWNPDWLAVADRVRSGFLGKTYVARVSRSASYWHPSHPPQARWMYDRHQGGGYLAGTVVHDLDFVCSLLGKPQSVCAEVRTSEPVRYLPDGETIEVTADDTAALLLRMEPGVIAVLSVSVIGVHADHYRLELFGSEGTIIGDGTLRSTDYRIGAASNDALTPLSVSDREPRAPGEPAAWRGRACESRHGADARRLAACFRRGPERCSQFRGRAAQPRRHRCRPPTGRVKAVAGSPSRSETRAGARSWRADRTPRPRRCGPGGFPTTHR